MRNLGLSLLSGLLMGASLPMQWGHWTPPNLGFLAWVALVPLMIAVRGLRPGRAYLVSLPGMLLAHAIMVYWFYTAVHVFGHLGVFTSIIVTFAGICFLAAITSLAPALAVWIDRHRPHWWTWPIVWAAIEFARNFDPFLQGFTFCNLIHSQYKYPLLFQVVNMIGPYWFLAVIVLVNGFVTRFFFSTHPRTHTHPHLYCSSLIIFVFVTLFSYGLYSRHHYRTATRHWPWLRVALLQGNIPQEEKWGADLAHRNFEVYREASEAAVAGGPDLIIWPEASFPWVYDLHLKTLPQDHHLPQTPILLGSIAREGDIYHNSAILLDANGNTMDAVHKNHLVPFGEYVPYKKILFFAKQLTRQVGDLQPGPRLRPLQLDGLPLGILICYEDTFPEIARSLVAQGGVLLVNITNDAWYGWSSAATQHLAASVFRAAENGRALVRATNTGISAVIGPDGGLQLVSSLYERATIVSEVRLGLDHTPYNRHGGAMDLGLPVLLGLVMAYTTWKGWRKKGLQ